MNKFLILLALCGTLFSGVKAQSCGIVGLEEEDTITLEAVSEDLEDGVTIARYQLLNVNVTAAVSNPFNKYLQALKYTNGVYEIRTSGSFASFVTVERSTEIRRTVIFTCEDGTTNRVTFVVPVPDTNNKAPTFSDDQYEVTITLPLVPSGDSTLVQTNIVVSDADLEAEFADVHITSSNKDFAVSVVNIPNPASHDFRVDFLVNNDIKEGIYATIITADDGKHPTITVVSIMVLPAGTPDPEQTLPTTEVSTTPPPTTEEVPETEATTNSEEETAETTEESETTTEDPTNCGLVGYDPSETVKISDLQIQLPTGTEIFRASTFNVHNTTVNQHPHNKYLSALRSSSNYWFITTEDYINFIPDQGTNVIERTANFFCVGGGIIQYRFEIDIYDGPIEEQTIAPEVKAPIKPFFF